MTGLEPITADGLLKGARQVPSPNFNRRTDGIDISLAVIHCISLPPGKFGTGDIELLFTNRLDPQAHPSFQEIAGMKVSSHFLISRTGETVQFVPCGRRAWHAGESSHRNRDDCNDFSIGIELEGTDSTPFENAQYDTLAELGRLLAARYPITCFAGHCHVAPQRKTDPGDAFDWDRLFASIGERYDGRD